MTDITELKRKLNERAQAVAEYLLPKGVREGAEWCAGSIGGEVGRSLKICVKGGKVGTWKDFAASGESGDLIDLWCQVRRLKLIAALDDIRKWLGVERPHFEKREKSYRRPEKPRCTAPKSAVLEYLTRDRKLSADAIRAYRVGEDGRTIILPSYLPGGELAFVKRLGIDRPGDKKVVSVEADCEPVLFGWSAIDPEAREAVITEGEIDAMTSFDYGWPALSVPFGGGRGNKQAWIESEYERLAQFEVINLALDIDEEGNIAAEEIANRLGRHRCRRVRLPHKDLNACRLVDVDAATIRACFQAAQSLDPPELVRAGAYADDVVELFWPKENVDQATIGYRLPWHKVGEQVGLRPGELTLWSGSTGDGKSQLLSNAIVGMAEQGAKICLASLEMTPQRTLHRMVKQAGNTGRPTEEYIRTIIDWLNGHLWIFAAVGKRPVSRVLECFEYARCRYGCDVFAIDSLMRLGIGAEDYDAQEKAVFEIVSWAVAKSVHVHLVAHARKGDRSAAQSVPSAEDVKGTSEIASNAANIIGVWRNRKLEAEIKAATAAADRGADDADEKLKELDAKPTVIVNVAKQRNGDFEGKFGLWFNPVTYQYRSSHDDRHGHSFVHMDKPPPKF